MDDYPGIQAELERKTRETLVEWLSEVQRGLCTRDAAKAALRALWGATAGLVSRELMDMIADATDAVDAETKRHGRAVVLGKGSNLAVIELPDVSCAKVRMIHTGKGAIRVQELCNEDSELTLREAQQKAEKCAEKLVTMGYMEI